MGAWSFMQPRLQHLLPPGVVLRYIGRPESASPAEGSVGLHTREQSRIVGEAFAAEEAGQAEAVGAAPPSVDGRKTSAPAAPETAEASEVTYAR